MMLRGHLINLAEVVTEKESLRNCKSSLVISWIGMGVARVLRVNASKPTVGWRGRHPHLVGWLQLVIDKFFIYLVHLN